jgi:hypothetical protein
VFLGDETLATIWSRAAGLGTMSLWAGQFRSELALPTLGAEDVKLAQPEPAA